MKKEDIDEDNPSQEQKDLIEELIKKSPGLEDLFLFRGFATRQLWKEWENCSVCGTRTLLVVDCFNCGISLCSECYVVDKGRSDIFRCQKCHEKVYNTTFIWTKRDKERKAAQDRYREKNRPRKQKVKKTINKKPKSRLETWWENILAEIEE